MYGRQFCFGEGLSARFAPFCVLHFAFCILYSAFCIDIFCTFGRFGAKAQKANSVRPTTSVPYLTGFPAPLARGEAHNPNK
jgi:hypothetical protein